jgi:plasmid stabilization system protein ParE
VNCMVDWRPDALQDLAAIWLATADRNAVASAAYAIDQALAVDPDTVGRLVFDTVRQYNHQPLGVEFEVIHADRRVWVLAVWDTTKGRPSPSGN